jgi:RNA polymerase sigma factor (sigma-70 family)
MSASEQTIAVRGGAGLVPAPLRADTDRVAASLWNAAPARSLDWLDDERLSRLAADGDPRAFGAIYERYLPLLTRYCRTIVRNDADAEDAAQNAMVSALRSLEAGTVPLRLRPWLYRIAQHEAISLVRRRRPDEPLDEQALPAGVAAEEDVAVRERLGQLLADLRALTERQRQALVLRELCGLTCQEIAATMECSEAAVHQTVFEARSALAQFGEGRDLDCEGVRRSLSECDGMRLRTRRVRAHLRGCDGCREFEAALLARRRDLRLLFPPGGGLSALGAALARLLGLGGRSGGRWLGGPLAGAGIKAAVVGLAVVAAGGGGVAAVRSIDGNERPVAQRAVAREAAAPAPHPQLAAAPAKRGPSHSSASSAGALEGHATPAAVAPAADGEGDQGGRGSGAPAGGNASGVTRAATAQPRKSRPVSAPPAAPTPVQDAVNDAVDQLAAPVQAVTDTAGAAVDQATATATGAAQGAASSATGAASSVAGDAQGTVGGLTGG